jgi:lipid A 3-O-deacylase
VLIALRKMNLKYKKSGFFVLLLVILIFDFRIVWGQIKLSQDSSRFCDQYHSKFEVGAEYLRPTRFSNKIETISLHGFFWRKRFEHISIKMSTGFICTYGWGTSRQLEDHGDTLTVIISYKTAAFGAGPVFQVDPTIITIKRFSVTAEAIGGVILYGNRFPYGGDIYNFMFKAGSSLVYKLNKQYSLKAGYRWMHISNGQGDGNYNPFYEAYGFHLSFVTYK